MRGPERVELADLGIDTDFLHHERVAGGNGFDFGEGERGVLEIFDTACGDIAAHDLGDEARFDFKQLPHIGVERSGGDVAEDADRFVAIALPQDASLPLLDVPGAPRRIELRERGQPFLDVRACAHLLGAAQQDANAAGIDGIEEQLLFGVGIGFVNEGDFGIGDTETDEVLAHFVVDVPALRIGRGEIAEDQLRAAFGGGFLPDGKDAAGGALEFGIVLGIFAQSHQAQVESRFSAIARDLEHVVDAGIDLLCLEGLGAFDQGLDVLLERVARRGCFDDRLAGFEFGPRQLQHVGGLDIGHGAEHGQQFRHIDEAGEAGVHAVAAAIGGEFEGGDGFGEAGGPGIEVPGAGAFEQRRVPDSAARCTFRRGCC